MANFVVICAMRGELEPIAAKLGATPNTHGDLCSSIGNNTVTLCLSGVGKVNAACAVTRAIMLYSPDAIINCGISGGLDSTLKIGELVVCDCVKYHDFQPAELLLRIPPYCRDMKTDGALTAAFETACAAAGIAWRRGIAASGDMIVTDAEYSARLRAELGATCVDMETCAVAHACINSGVRFAVIRGISDFADEQALPEMERNEFKVTHALAEIVFDTVTAQ